MKRRLMVVRLGGIAATDGALLLAASAPANEPGIIVPGPPDLPPQGPINGYVNPYAKYWSIPELGIRICIANPVHFAGQVLARDAHGTDEVESFNSEFFGDMSVIGANGTQQFGRIGLTGVTTTIVHEKVGHVTGAFDTEMIALDLAGAAGGFQVMIRESPTKGSTGQTSISALGGNLYHIESFFDVWTELSLDGGATWNPADGNDPARMTLIPEPGSGLILAVGGIGMSLLKRRRRNCA